MLFFLLGLIDPRVDGKTVVDDALGEPELDLLLGVLDRVRAVADVHADLNAEIEADGSGGAVGRVGGAEHGTAGLDGVLADNDNGNNGAREHVLEESREEGLLLEVGVVGLEQLLGGLEQLEGGNLEALVLEAEKKKKKVFYY